MLLGLFPARFWVLFCSVLLGYWTTGSSQWCQFFKWGVFECDITHRQSVAVLCMLYKTICNLMHPLYCALPGPYVQVRVIRGVLGAHRYTYVPPRCRISQSQNFYSLVSISVERSWWRIIRRCGTGGLQEQLCFSFLFFHSMGWYWGAGVFGLIRC